MSGRISVEDRERTNLIPDVSLNRAFGEAPLRLLGRENWKELDQQVRRRIQSDDDAFATTAPAWAPAPEPNVWDAVVRRREGFARLAAPPPPQEEAPAVPQSAEPDDLTYTDSEPEDGTE